MAHIKNILTENEELKARNEFLERMVKGLKIHNQQLTKERNDAIDENFKRIEESNRLFGELQDIKHMSMWEFAAKYCNDEDMEEAGHQLARSLLGHRQTDEEIAIEAAENKHDYYVGDDF